MSDYRLYCLGDDGHISLGEWVNADSDEEAVLKARDMKPDTHLREVWIQSRLIAKISPFDRLEGVVP